MREGRGEHRVREGEGGTQGERGGGGKRGRGEHRVREREGGTQGERGGGGNTG